jgi:arsenate reductase
MVHVGFEDPPRLTTNLPDGEGKLAVYRRVRDEIRRFVERLPDALKSETRNPRAEGRTKAEARISR